MKQKILAICLFILIISFVVSNSLILQSIIDKTIKNINAFSVSENDAMNKFDNIHDTFTKRLAYIGITVSHDDLTNIEDCFAELKGCLAVNDINGAKVTQYRLISFLEHLRRLVGFNIDTII